MFGNRERNQQRVIDIVDEINKDFVYTRDHRWFDAWTIMKRQSDGKFYGDCEDFALTVIWRLCNRNVLVFIFNFLLLGRYNIWLGRWRGEGHAIGFAHGLFFDNTVGKATDKSTMSKEVTLWFPLITPLAWFILVPKLILGLLKKIVKNR
jgi:hypothetical protein